MKKAKIYRPCFSYDVEPLNIYEYILMFINVNQLSLFHFETLYPREVKFTSQKISAMFLNKYSIIILGILSKVKSNMFKLNTDV